MSVPRPALIFGILVLFLFIQFVGISGQTKSNEQIAESERLAYQALEFAKAGNFDEALKVAERSVEIREKIFGKDHPVVAATLGVVGAIYFRKGDGRSAEKVLLRALAINEKATGRESEQTILSIELLIQVYSSLGEFSKAEPYQLRYLEVRQKSLGKDHPNIAVALNNLGFLYSRIGNLAKAEQFYLQALAVREKALGPENPVTGLTIADLAALYAAQGNFEKSVWYYERLISICEKTLGKEHPDTALAWFELGRVFEKKGDSHNAEKCLIRSLDIREKALGEVNQVTFQTLTEVSAFYQNQGQYLKAEPFQLRMLQIIETRFGPEHPETAISLNNLGILYKRLGKTDKAEQLLLRANQIDEKALGPDSPETATTLENLAGVFVDKGDFKKAEAYYLRVLLIREKTVGLNDPLTAGALSRLAGVFADMGKFKKSEEFYLRALEVFGKSQSPDPLRLAECLGNLGSLYTDLGDYQKAESAYERAIIILEKIYGRNHPRSNSFYEGLAFIAKSKGEYSRAETILTQILEVEVKAVGEEHPLTAEALNNLGLLYLDRGDAGRAEGCLKRALTIYQKVLGEEHPSTAACLNNFAILYQSIGDYSKAAAFQKKAVTVVERAFGADNPKTATAINNLAQIFYSSEDFDQAETFGLRALGIQEKLFGENHLSTATSLSNLGLVYISKGDPTKARNFLVRALSVMEKLFGESSPNTLRVMSNLGLAYLNEGNLEKALLFQVRVNEGTERDFTRNLQFGSEKQKLLYAQTTLPYAYLMVSTNVGFFPRDVTATRAAMTVVLQRKGRSVDIFADQLNVVRRKANPEDRKVIDDLKAVRTMLANLNLETNPKVDPQAKRIEIDRLEKEAERLEGEIGKRSTEFREQIQPVTWETVKAHLPKDSALVEFYQYSPFNFKGNRYGEARMVVYVQKWDSEGPVLVDLGPVTEIEPLVNGFRKALIERSPDVKKRAQDLDAKIMKPVRTTLGPIKLVFLAPDGSLNLIPFEALVDENNQYLIENFSFITVSSGRDLLRMRSNLGGGRPPVIFANPTYDLSTSRSVEPTPGRRSVDFRSLNYPPLPGTAEEAVSLKKVMTDAIVFTDRDADEATLKKIESPWILHIATHGFFFPDQENSPLSDSGRLLQRDGYPARVQENPLLRCGIVLAGVKQGQSGTGEDGVLTALETIGLNLDGTRLVVLSACETGRGEVMAGQGVYGLRRALVLAGSEAQILSLWQVADSATRDLMSRYYRRLQLGEGRAAALRETQLEMLHSTTNEEGQRGQRTLKRDKADNSQTDWSHPFYWSAFVYSGDWTALPPTPKAKE